MYKLINKKIRSLRYIALGLFLLGSGIVVFANASSVSAATITVNTTVDEVNLPPAPVGSQCSITEAVYSMNQASDFGGCIAAGTYGVTASDEDTIIIPAGNYPSLGDYYRFVGGLIPTPVLNNYTPIPIRASKLTITGDTNGQTKLNMYINQTFFISNDTLVEYKNLSFEGGERHIEFFNYSQPQTITNSTFLNASNTSLSRLFLTPSAGKLFINDSYFTGNAIAIDSFECDVFLPDSVYINNSRFISNQQAIKSCGHLEVRNSEFIGNITLSGDAGAISIRGTVLGAEDIIENSTFSDNSGFYANHIFIEKLFAGGADDNLTKVTLRNNTLHTGSNPAIAYLVSNSDQLTLINNLIFSKTNLQTCGFGTLPVVNLNNISSDNSCTGFSSTNFAPSEADDLLKNNSSVNANTGAGGLFGPARTLALLPGSQAIDRGNTNCPVSDQRGVSRPQNGGVNLPTACDVGAFEYVGFANVFDPPSARKTVSETGLAQVEWKMVWINDGNITSELVSIEDPIKPGLTFVPGSLVCVVNGQSVEQLCAYDSTTNTVIWRGFIAPDPGGTDESNTANEVVITFRTNYIPLSTDIANQASAFWDENGDGAVDNLDANRLNNTPVLTDADTLVLGNQITKFTPLVTNPLQTTKLVPLLAPAGISQSAALSFSISISGITLVVVALRRLFLRL